MRTLYESVFNNLPKLNTYIEDTDNTIELLFAGDAMIHGAQILSAEDEKEHKFNFEDCFKYLKKDLDRADLSIVNIEAPLGGAPYYDDYKANKFNAPDEYAKQLHNVGFKIAALANNNIYDKDLDGVKRTLDVLDNFGMWHIGLYRDDIERQMHTPYIVKVKGVRIAFINYTYGLNDLRFEDSNVNIFMGPDEKLREKSLEHEIELAQKQEVDIICAIMHWGKEYDMMPSKRQETIAKYLQDKGVDIVVGSHTHTVQRMELKLNEDNGRNQLVAYSLGNLISSNDLSKPNSRGGALLKVKISKETKQIVSAQYKLVFTSKPVYMHDDNYYTIPIKAMNLLRKDQDNDYNIFINNAHNLSLATNINVTEEI